MALWLQNKSLLWIARDILGGNGRLLGIFSILGRCASQSSTDNKQPPRELLPVRPIVTHKESIIPPRDNELGNIHFSTVRVPFEKALEGVRCLAEY